MATRILGHSLRTVGPALFALAWMLTAEAWAGTVTPFAYHSAALGRDQVAQVYRPAGDPPPGGWPVLYLLHGLNGAAVDWNKLGELGRTLDGMIAGGRVRPMVVVMPEGGNSWYVDSAAVGGPGDYARAIGADLPAAVEDALPVSRLRGGRAICGNSMGGYGALRLALSMPDRYGAVAALSPALWQNIPLSVAAQALHDGIPDMPYFKRAEPGTVTIGLALPPNGHHFGGAFGTPFDPKRFDEANVFTLLQRAIDAHNVLPAVYITVGDDDSHRLWRGSIAFFETMQATDREIEFRITNGDHNWALWKASIVDALLFVDAHFAAPAVR